MADENELTNLPATEEAVPPAPTEEAAPSAEEAAAPVVDETPDPAALKAEIERLKEEREKAKEEAIKWRKRKHYEERTYYRDQERPRAEPPPEPPQVGVEPKASDFDDYDKYVAALTDHRVKRARAEWEIEDARKKAQEVAQQRSQSLQEKLQEGFQKYSDFEEVAFDRTATHITPMIVDILADCDHPADVAYYLAKNRVEGASIARMTPLKAARAIAQLEAKLATETPASPSPAPRKVSTAPPPISPVGSRGGVTRNPENMTLKEFEEWRLKQGAKRY